CHRLLRDGAELLESPSDLLAALGIDAPAAEPSGRASHPLLLALERGPRTADELARIRGTTPAEVLVTLIELELAGAVARGPGGIYRRCGPDALTRGTRARGGA